MTKLDENLESNAESRVLWIDIAKAIAIIGVAISHIEFSSSIVRAVTLFCLPLFFMISGYLYNREKYENDFKTLVKASIKRLVIPGYTAFAILHPVCNLNQIKTALYASGIAVAKFRINRIAWGLWFFFCLFLVRIFLYFFIKITKDLKMKLIFNIIFCFCIAFLGTYIGTYVLKLPWSADIAMVGLFFAYIGYLLKTHEFFENKKLILPTVIICAIIGFFDFQYGDFQMNNRVYSSNPILSITGATSLSILVIYISKFIANLKNFSIYKKFLQYIGVNSFVIVFAHLLITAYDNIHLLALICDIFGALIIVEILNLIPPLKECFQTKSITEFFPTIKFYKEKIKELTKKFFTRFITIQ